MMMMMMGCCIKGETMSEGVGCCEERKIERERQGTRREEMLIKRARCSCRRDFIICTVIHKYMGRYYVFIVCSQLHLLKQIKKRKKNYKMRERER